MTGSSIRPGRFGRPPGAPDEREPGTLFRVRERAAARPFSRADSLLGRVAISNAVVLIVASVLVGLILAPGGFARFAVSEGLVLAGTLTLLVLVNFVLLRSVFGPLERLRRFAAHVDLSHPYERLELEPSTADVAAVVEAINEMLARLERAQRERARMVLASQEEERRRIAQELHDEIGQSLTAVLLGLGHLAKQTPSAGEALAPVQELARTGLEDVRRIALELRPEALDGLGLASALVALCERLSATTDVAIDRHIERRLPPLTPEQELGVYRIAQEALTNLVRHSGASVAHVSLAATVAGVRLEVTDEGRGFGDTVPGSGLRGMRERAELIGASLSIRQSVVGGVTVELDVRLDTSDA
jgi:two-component system, NarL family, sensor histidine kinase UhpB